MKIEFIAREETAMPSLGEIRRGRELGKKNGWTKYIWCSCEACGIPRWSILLKDGSHRNRLCLKCSVEKSRGNSEFNNRRKSGRYINSHTGYVFVRLERDDFYFPMALVGGGFVQEHRLVMAKYLNRCLLSWETIHHKNGVKTDNRLENLEIVSNSRHNGITRMASEIKRLQEQVTLLEDENVILSQTLKNESRIYS